MARGPLSAEQKKRIAKAQKKRWKAWRKEHAVRIALPPVDDVPTNGPPSNGSVQVDHRLLLSISGHELQLTLDEARHLRDALSNALPAS
jgi:hypothetical protein